MLRTTQGATFKLSIKTPWNLTGYQISSQLRNTLGELIGSFSVSLQSNPYTGLPGMILLTLPIPGTQAIGNDYWFDVRLVAPNQEVTYIPRQQLMIDRRETQ